MLWLLKARDTLEYGNDPWSPWYDKTFGMVIRADSEKEAREVGQHKCKHNDECKEGITTEPWIDENYSTCIQLSYEGEKKVILEDFMAA